MVSKRTSERTEAVDGLEGEGALAMTRRDVLTVSAGGIPGFLFGARGRTSSSASDFRAEERPPLQAGEWTEVATLTADDAVPGARFGYSVAIEGDRALVGADTDNENGTDAGAAYVFELDGDNRWVQTQKLTADDAAPGDRFGDVVALDEGRALVGARRSDSRGPDAGAAYVFEVEGDRWAQTHKLTAADAAPDDRFGRAVALDASRALVGTRLDDEAASDAGAVYVFEVEGDRWVQTQKLTAADANQGDRFGGAVALGGDRALVGAGRDDERAEDAGAVYPFAFEEGQWRQTQKLTPDDADPGTRFGNALARERNTAIVGAEHDSEKGDDAGAVYAFQLEQNRWRQIQKLTAADASPKARFGSAVALGGNRTLVGAINDDAAVDKGGAVYVFTRESANENGTAESAGGELPFVTPRNALITLGGVVAVIVTVVIVFGRGLSRVAAFLPGRADEPPPELLSDEERVLGLLRDNGGRVKQQDVKEALGWSQTKTSNVVNDLQDDGKIEVYRIGNENTLALPGEMDV